jgi:peptidoglycan-associated lipoprotein
MQKKFFIYLFIATLISSCTKDHHLSKDKQGSNNNFSQSELQNNENEIFKKIIYFNTNSFDVIDNKNNEDINNIKKSLSKDAKFTIIVEGHCDERGSEKYNYKLGKKRANAVKKLLVKNGIKPSKIAIVSYGETKPAVAGSEESAWQKNRRAEIIILK